MCFSSKKDVCVCAGDMIKHPSGKMVKLVKCSYFKEGDEVRSFWYWKEIVNDSLGEKVKYGKAWA